MVAELKEKNLPRKTSPKFSLEKKNKNNSKKKLDRLKLDSVLLH